MHFEVSKAHEFLVRNGIPNMAFLLRSFGLKLGERVVRSQLLLQYQVCLPSAMSLTLVMDSNVLNVSSQISYFVSCLGYSILITTLEKQPRQELNLQGQSEL